MRTRASSSSMSWSGITGALCGLLAILLGSVVLVGWALHSSLLIQVVPGLAPMQRNTAFDFALSGLALLGVVWRKPRLTFIGSGIVATFAAGTLLEYLFRVNFGIDELLGAGYLMTQTSSPGRMSPTTALCFIVLAAGFTLAQTSPRKNRSAVLGVTGLLVAAVGATCFIGVASGTSDALAWGDADAGSPSDRGGLPPAGNRRYRRGLGPDPTRTGRACMGSYRRQFAGCNGPNRIVAGIFSQEPNQDWTCYPT